MVKSIGPAPCDWFVSDVILTHSVTNMQIEDDETEVLMESDTECDGNSETRKQSCWKQHLGLLLAFMSGLLFTLFTSMIKLLDSMPPSQLVMVRGLLQTAVTAAIALHRHLPFLGPDTRTLLLVLLNAAVGGTRVLLVFVSFGLLPVRASNEPSRRLKFYNYLRHY